MRYPSRSFLACLGLGVFLLIPHASATDIQQSSLEDLLKSDVRAISSASRIEQLIDEAPGAVTVLTQRDIRRHGWRTLSDLLRSAPGINISYNTLYSSATIRGLSGALDLGSHLLLLVDGERMTGNISDVSPLGQDMPIDMEWIDRVEIVTGASSAVYGANAVLAVVNIITQPPEAIADLEFTAGLGGGNARQLRASGGTRWENGHVSGSASRFSSDGYLDNDAILSERVFGRIAAGDFNFTAWSLRYRKDYPFINPPVFSEGETQTDHSSATLSWNRALSPSAHARVSLQYGSYDLGVTYGNRDLLLRQQQAKGAWHSLDASISQRGDAHTLIYGFEYMRSPDAWTEGHLVSPVSQVREFREGISFARRALHVQDIWTLSEGLKLHLALRHEADDRLAKTLNLPRVGVVYQHDPATALKLTYGESFRVHPAFELGSLPKTVREPLLLEPPEQVRQWEARLEHDWSSSTHTGLSLYHIKATDQVRYYPGEDFEFNYGESSSLLGLEAVLNWKSSDGSRLRVSLTRQQGDYDQDGARLYNSPETLVKLNYSRPIPRLGAFLGIEALHTGKRKTLLDTLAPGYGLVNLTLCSDQRMGRWDWQLGLYNVFDAQFEDPAPYSLQLQAIPQQGRTWRAQMRLQF